MVLFDEYRARSSSGNFGSMFIWINTKKESKWSEK